MGLNLYTGNTNAMKLIWWVTWETTVGGSWLGSPTRIIAGLR